MPTARTKANRKYNEKAYDRLYITVAKGQKEEIQGQATAAGKSLNAFINEAIEEKLQTCKNKAIRQV